MVAETYHGKPCKRGHTLRYRSNNHCVVCSQHKVERNQWHLSREALAEARAIGQRIYKGQACRVGHAGFRYVSNHGCIECLRRVRQEQAEYHAAYLKYWHKQGIERRREYQRHYYFRNSNKILDQRKHRRAVWNTTLNILYGYA